MHFARVCARVCALTLTHAALFAPVSAGTCAFTQEPITCGTPGQPCRANTDDFVCDGRPGGNGPYVPATCIISSGGVENATGFVGTGPSFEQAYSGSCTALQHAQCQYVDPLFGGDPKYPEQLSCVPGTGSTPSRCRLVGKQSTGDPCAEDNECASRACVNHVCRGLVYNAPCSEGACGAGMYCHPVNHRCDYVLQHGAVCTWDEQCPHSSMCNMEGAPSKCTGVFTQLDGVTVSNPDLCYSGMRDAQKKCIDNFDWSKVGQPCDGTLPPVGLPRGYNCYCAADGQYRLAPVTMRTQRMVTAQRDAWTCLGYARAPNGLPCSNPFAVTPRVSELGSCGYLRCHAEFLESFAAAAELVQPPMLQFDHRPPCVQSLQNAVSAAADANTITCALPAIWAAAGWNCISAAPPAGKGGLSGGAAFGVSLVVILAVAGIALGAYRWRTGAWPACFGSIASKLPSMPSLPGRAAYTSVGPTSSSALTSGSTAYGSYTA